MLSHSAIWDAIDSAARREHLGGQRQFERAGYTFEQQPRRLATVISPRLRCAFDQLIDQRIVEARRNDNDATLAGIELSGAGE